MWLVGQRRQVTEAQTAAHGRECVKRSKPVCALEIHRIPVAGMFDSPM